MDAFTRSNIEDGDAGRVVELGSRPGFPAESHNSNRVGCRPIRQYFERDMPAEGILYRFINDAHSTATNHAEYSVIPKSLRQSPSFFPCRQVGLFHDNKRGKN